MKRSVFIIISILLALTLIGVWAYLLFFNTGSQPNDEFADFDFENINDQNTVVVVNDSDPVVDVVNLDRLRQLTTGPVVGFSEMTDLDNQTKILYTQAGTGHIFSIDLDSGEEERLSGNTFGGIEKAVFTPDGRAVMISSGNGFGQQASVGVWSSSTNKFVFSNIEEVVADFTTTENNTFLLAIDTTNSLLVVEYDPNSGTRSSLFTTPFVEVSFLWGRFASSTHYFYPKASARLEGYLYSAKDGLIKRLPIEGRGLTAIGDESYVLYAKQVERDYLTFLYNKETGEEFDFNFLHIITDKCSLRPVSSTFICGTNSLNKDSNTPDEWYRGEITYNDAIWEIDPVNLGSRKLVEIAVESGRSVDTQNLSVGASDKNLLFQNKTDRTLWMYILIEEEVISAVGLEEPQVEVVSTTTDQLEANEDTE